MADYYPLIARAIAGLDPSAPGESRRALYERARAALIAQLRSVEPPLSESEITRERLSLEEAVRKVESEAAQPAREASRGRASRRVGRWILRAPLQGPVLRCVPPPAPAVGRQTPRRPPHHRRSYVRGNPRRRHCHATIGPRSARKHDRKRGRKTGRISCRRAALVRSRPASLRFRCRIRSCRQRVSGRLRRVVE